MLTYKNPSIITPFNKKPVEIIFADDVASGRPCPIIDKIIQKKILPYYSNTHSNAYCGQKMKNEIESVRKILIEEYKLDESYKILFTGNGATGAINHLTNLIDFNTHSTTIYISQYEHYSNHLPWIEKAKSIGSLQKIKIEIIEINDLIIAIDKMFELIKMTNLINHLHIISITACSNVTGIISEIDKIKERVADFKKNNYNIYLFFDCACIGPYKKISCEGIDAIYISMHKFLGGYSSPGILIAKSKIFEKKTPFCPGGGCVKSIKQKDNIEYVEDIEQRESAGTPNIVGIIKIKYIFKIRNMYINYMLSRETLLTKYVHKKLEVLTQKNNNLKVIGLSKHLENRLPIISFGIIGVHYNLVVTLLNDLFGIQTRGGISCCGLLTGISNYDLNGWCRVTFSWLMDDYCVDYILNSIDFVATNYKNFEIYYKYNKETNLFEFDKSLV